MMIVYLIAIWLGGVGMGWVMSRAHYRRIIEAEAKREYQQQSMPTPQWCGHINGLRTAAIQLGSTKYHSGGWSSSTRIIGENDEDGRKEFDRAHATLKR